MDIDTARTLKLNDRIVAINHRENLDGPKPTRVASTVPEHPLPHYSIHEEAFLWIHTDQGIWPSNRLKRVGS